MINGFDSSAQNAYEHNLALTVTIDFSANEEMYNAFKDEMELKNKKWHFSNMKATYHWRK